MFHQGCDGRRWPGSNGVPQVLHDPAVPCAAVGDSQVVDSSGREKRKPTPGSVMMWRGPPGCGSIFLRKLLTCTRSVCASSTHSCLLYTSDAADDLLCVDLGGRRIIKK